MKLFPVVRKLYNENKLRIDIQYLKSYISKKCIDMQKKFKCIEKFINLIFNRLFLLKHSSGKVHIHLLFILGSLNHHTYS